MKTWEIAKDYAKEVSIDWMAKGVSAVSKVRTADREKLRKALQASGVVAAGVLVGSKLFGLHVVLGMLGGTVMLSDLLDRIDSAEDRERVEAALRKLKESGTPVSHADLAETLKSISDK